MAEQSVARPQGTSYADYGAAGAPSGYTTATRRTSYADYGSGGGPSASFGNDRHDRLSPLQQCAPHLVSTPPYHAPPPPPPPPSSAAHSQTEYWNDCCRGIQSSACSGG